MMSTDLGHLNLASDSLQKATSSSSVVVVSGLSATTAFTDSPQVSSGTPMIATSMTDGCSASTRSTSGEYTFSPPVMIMSLSRSSTKTKPSSSTLPMSPVRNQPSSVTTAAVSSGLPR